MSMELMNTLLLLLIAGLNFYTAHISRRTELNTNSMKDALVKRTAETAHLEGKVEVLEDVLDKGRAGK